MVRVNTVKVDYPDGTVALVTIRLRNKRGLTLDEATYRQDMVVDKVVNAITSIPYSSDAPLRSVSIR